MASDKVQNLTDANFDATIKGSAVPVLVDFWAEWCAPCRRLAPAVDAVANELEGKILVAKVNVDENPMTPGRFNVRGIPTLIVFKGGEVVDQVVGLISKDELKQLVLSHA
jgi:thioredoxin 1